ncbi:MAG: VanZ family protein, partial [Bacteroidetes bacterium]
LWASLILLLCLMPGKDLPSITLFEFDKIVHFGIYMILSLLMYYGWKKQNAFLSLHEKTVLKILILTFAYGFAVEVIQELFTADRHFDILDALANSAGAVAGSFLSKYIKPKLSH